jgi:hypothetical protein
MTILNADRWLTGILTTDATLLAALGGRVYMDIAPEKTLYPMAILDCISATPVTNASADRVMDEELWQVSLITNLPSYSGLEAIADRVRAVVHKGSGTGVIGAVFEQETRLTTVEGGKIYRQIILEFRLFTQ